MMRWLQLLVCEIPEARNGKGATWLPTPRLSNQSTPTSPLLLSSHLLPAGSDADADSHDEEGDGDDEEQSVEATSPFLFSKAILRPNGFVQNYNCLQNIGMRDWIKDLFTMSIVHFQNQHQSLTRLIPAYLAHETPPVGQLLFSVSTHNHI